VVDAVESFPRQRARTRGFRLGAPRAFTIRTAPDGGTRVVFIRSADGRSASGDLWVADSHDGYSERLVVDASTAGPAGQVPAAELARRERLREVTEGITAYSLDSTATHVAFALDGEAFRANIDEGTLTSIDPGSPAVDPRISPDGRFVAYVSDGRVRLFDAHSGVTTTLTPPEGPEITWGLADFIAAEELERHRGLWWLPDSSGVLAERVDESDVEIRWIGDPAQPEREPRAHRYPAAGTANAAVSLHKISVDGRITDLEWDHQRYCYLASVNVTDTGQVIVSVLSRDQRRQSILRLADEQLEPIAQRERSPWITVVSGVPTVDPSGALIEVIDDDDCFRLTRDSVPITPAGMNVEAVLDVNESSAVVQAATDATARLVAEIDWDAGLTVLTEESGWHAAIVHDGVRVQIDTSLDDVRSSFRIIDATTDAQIPSFAEIPNLQPNAPRIHRAGRTDLATVVLLPRHHEPGMRWPVICSPYAGPHAQRVVQAGQAFLTDQWLADQGFAVVIADGRGTPGRGPSWEYAVHGDLAGPVLEDQVEALISVAELEPAMDVSRVGIRGWSFGGYLAALAVLDRPDVFHAAVAGAPVTDWRMYDTAYTERYLGNPNDDDSPYQRTSLLNRAAALTRPLLLIHGLADDNVLAAHTLQLSSALLAAGKQHDVLPLSGVTHMTPQEVVAENLLLTEVEFFRRHLS
jgi:dipeptidyl-peptidase-4